MKVNGFMAKACEIQRKGCRRFVIFQRLSSPRWTCRPWEPLRNKAGVRQLGVFLQEPLRDLGKTLRVSTNSEPIAEALMSKRKEADIEESIQKGCEVEKYLSEGFIQFAKLAKSSFGSK